MILFWPRLSTMCTAAPGYEDYLEKEMPEDWRGKQEAYCFSHCMLSYIYGGSDAFRGLSEETKGAIRRCVEAVKGFPEIPEPELTFSRSKLTASFDPKEGRQQTETVTCTGDPANQVKIPLAGRGDSGKCDQGDQ